MKFARVLLFSVSASVCVAPAVLPLPALAQDRIYRCGNEYTNKPTEAQLRHCKLVEGGNVTVVKGTRPAAAAAGPGGASAARPAASGPRVDSGEQRARDADARAILEAELKKAEARHAELLREYNHGEPERLGSERNYQKYLDRVAELKASIARSESDIAGIKRELARLGGAASTSK